jgi:PPK2 family polyphosphate:nucleotide phosphotransferase
MNFKYSSISGPLEKVFEKIPSSGIRRELNRHSSQCLTTYRIGMDIKKFLTDEKVSLKSTPTEINKLYSSKEDGQSKLAEIRNEIIDSQELLYADGRYSILLILQGMDTSGKDGAVRHVFSGVNPQGVRVTSFKKPSEEELSHDYLWRCSVRLPERGQIGVFNRSYYEEVIVVKVMPKLLELQRLPEVTSDIWKERYQEINQFERRLINNGTKVIKCFFHLSKDEQRKRLLERLDDKKKNWKFQSGDLEARREWGEFQKAYEACLENTNSKEAPWYIVPADDKQNARIIVASILRDALKDLPLSYPKMDKAFEDQIALYKKELG